jgi:putative DNA primase/helicase
MASTKKAGAFAQVGRKLWEAGWSVIPIEAGSKRPGLFINGQWRGMTDWSKYCKSPASPEEIEEWESFPDAGVGIACGPASQVIVMDFDNRPDLHAEIQSILPPSPIYKKGVKGFSCFYKYNGETSRSFGLRNSETGRTETVVELLSSGKQSVLPPSFHPEGVQYRYISPDTLLDITLDDLPTLPSDLFDKIQRVLTGQQIKQNANLREPNPPKHPPLKRLPKEPISRIEDALSVIDPNDYDTWIKIGMAVHSEYPDEQGLILWNHWSRGSQKYDGLKSCEYKWNSFKTANPNHHAPISVATLFSTAKQCGWDPAQWEAKQAQLRFAALREMVLKCSTLDESMPTLLKSITDGGFTHAQREKLLGLLSESCGVSVKALRSDMKDLEKSTDSKLQEIDIARLVIRSFGEENILTASRGTTWIWSEHGVWKEVDDQSIKQRIHQIAEGRIKLVSGIINSILGIIKTETFIAEHCFNSDTKAINCPNGELHYENPQWVLKPHNRLHYRTTQIPVPFDPVAKAPRFEQFLHEVFLGDSDAAEKRACVLEMLGYTLLCSTQYEKFIMLLGNTRNGKSVLLEVVKGMCGVRNVAAVCPSKFNNPFNRAHLDGKLANIITELAEGAEIADAELKSIVSGELMTAEHKHQAPFEFEPVCTCWFGTNHMPFTRDYSGALGKRTIIINFNRQFEGKDCDPGLKKKLLQELPGILNLALAHLSQVLQRDSFTSCSSSIETLNVWQLENDQVAQFIDDACELGPEYKVTSEDAYQAYRIWASCVGVRQIVTQRTFSNRLARKGIKRQKGTNGVRLLVGIQLRDKSWR